MSDQRALQTDNREHSIIDVLHPGYPDAAYDADGSNNVGQLSVDHDASAKVNYYQWISTKALLNDYHLVVRYTLPQKFIRWQAIPLTLFYKTASADSALNALDIEVYDTAGNAVTLAGTSTSLASASWTSTALTFSGSPVWTPGQSFVVKLRLSSKDNSAAQLGDLELRMVTLQKE